MIVISRWLAIACAATVLLCHSTIGIAQDSSASARVRVLKLDGTRLTGLAKPGADSLRVDDAEISFDKIVEANWPNRRVRPAANLIVLSNGDQIAAEPRNIDEDTLVAVRGDAVVRVPLEFVSAVLFDLPETTVARRIRWAGVRDKAKQDTLGLVGGDTLSGELVQLSGGKLRITTPSGDRSVAMTRIQNILFSDELVSPIPQMRRIAIIQTTSDDILSVARLRRSNQTLQVETTAGAKLSVSDEQIRRVQFCHDQIQLLAEVPPLRSQQTQMLARRLPMQANLNVQRLPLRSSSEREPLGIGVISGTSLTWQLDGQAQTLHTRFAMDDITSRGAAVFVITTDGREVFRSKVTRKNQAQRAPAVKLKGVNKLTLSVEYGPNGDLNDIANWLAPVIVKTGE